MGFLSWFIKPRKDLDNEFLNRQTDFSLYLDKILKDISSLSYSEKDKVKKELLKKYYYDKKLTDLEVIQVLRYLVDTNEISENDLIAVLKKFNISYEKYRSVLKQSFSEYNKENHYTFTLKDIKNNLFGILSLTDKEKKIVEEELIKEYKDDGKLDRKEIVISLKNLYKKRLISENDLKSIWSRFGITKEEINRYR